MAARMDAQLAILEAKERVDAGAGGQGRPHAVVLLRLPAQHLHRRAGRLARDGRHRLPLHGDLDGPRHHRLHADGRRGRAVGRASSRSPPSKHVFANLGDGTYFHSGLLAIRQSIAAGVNITYKILYNDAVAMTGGQQVGERPEGHSVLQIAHSLMAEGVREDGRSSPTSPRSTTAAKLPPGVDVHHRDELDRDPARAARDQGRHRHHLRPDLRHREAPPAQARHHGRSGRCAW